MKKLLVTGASGLLGGHIFLKAQKNFESVGTHWNNSPNNKTGNWHQIDLTDKQNVKSFLAEFQPDVIIHSAANSNLDQCENDQESAYKTNVAATKWLAEYSGENGVRLIFVSSDMVFDGNRGMYFEDDPIFPLAYYGQSKVDAEKAVKEMDENFVIARSALIYGRPVTGGSSFSNWMENNLAQGKEIGLYTDQFRTPVYVENIADAFLELAENEFCGTIHLGGANRINRFDFGLELCSICGYDKNLLIKSSMSDSTPTAPRPRDVSLSTEKANNVLITRLLSTKEGLEEMVKMRQ